MTSHAQTFGNAHTKIKLEALGKYLQAYVTVLKKQKFNTVYFDVCAGSGSSKPKIALEGQSSLFDEDIIIEGSPTRALKVTPPFNKYLFNDLKLKNVKSLENLAQTYPEIKDRIEVTRLDASEAVSNFCDNTNWSNTRAVVFLDPFGIKPIKYSLIEKLAATKAVDLWYYIPVGAMNRQVSNKGDVLPQSESSLDECVGVKNWRDKIISEEKNDDLFGTCDQKLQKIGDTEKFEKVMISRLNETFDGRVSNRKLALGKDGKHEYTLVFACANPTPQAHQLAISLADAILK